LILAREGRAINQHNFHCQSSPLLKLLYRTSDPLPLLNHLLWPFLGPLYSTTELLDLVPSIFIWREIGAITSFISLGGFSLVDYI
jgi:hypothetical protein